MILTANIKKAASQLTINFMNLTLKISSFSLRIMYDLISSLNVFFNFVFFYSYSFLLLIIFLTIYLTTIMFFFCRIWVSYLKESCLKFIHCRSINNLTLRRTDTIKLSECKRILLSCLLIEIYIWFSLLLEVSVVEFTEIIINWMKSQK